MANEGVLTRASRSGGRRNLTDEQLTRLEWIARESPGLLGTVETRELLLLAVVELRISRGIVKKCTDKLRELIGRIDTVIGDMDEE